MAPFVQTNTQTERQRDTQTSTEGHINLRSMVDPSCQIPEASVAVKYAKQQKYSTLDNVDEDMSGVLQLKLHNP